MKPSFLLLSTESLAAVLHDAYCGEKGSLNWRSFQHKANSNDREQSRDCQMWRHIADEVMKSLPDLIQALPSSEQRLCMERAASLQPLNSEPVHDEPVKAKDMPFSLLCLHEVKLIMSLYLPPDGITADEAISRILQLLDRPDVVQMLTTKPAKVQPETAEAFEAYKATAEAKMDELSAQVTELTKKLADISAIAGL